MVVRLTTVPQIHSGLQALPLHADLLRGGLGEGSGLAQGTITGALAHHLGPINADLFRHRQRERHANTRENTHPAGEQTDEPGTGGSEAVLEPYH
eukprot:CAMPEP_0204315370 /NCGR_PEP_ID=MMETSP0469-20131031/4789_1 /ASSEMBLY_ACC=CAM_ASM_000384 /TAXON_ID=2969 /ORGANISM="Oxyrrhis marina" /LENGTH=94 /DNA_ID=CAMNT_0051296005 /DNA_START=202 /DNA_END=483 /DNA_ORIENTATION=+